METTREINMTREEYLQMEWDLLYLIEHDSTNTEEYYEVLALVEEGRKLYPEYTTPRGTKYSTEGRGE